mgnify:FL=1
MARGAACSQRGYLEYRDNTYRTHALTIGAIWKGENQSTALLTVFRHYDSASVSEGFIGQSTKTDWIIDYPTLERIYYDLVVNFDVFGSVSHQILTRIYMDYLRMESEGLFLSFLPAADESPSLNAGIEWRWHRPRYFMAIPSCWLMPRQQFGMKAEMLKTN